MPRNTDLLLQHNSNTGFQPRFNIKGGLAEYIVADRIIDIKTVSRIINAFHCYLNKYRYGAPAFHLKCIGDKVNIIDKLTWTLLESACYDMVVNHNKKLYVSGNFTKTISSAGIDQSPLIYLTKANWDLSKFEKTFQSDIAKYHYRSIIPENAAESGLLGTITGDVYFFIYHLSSNEEYAEKLSEVISELIGNACEHAKSDCIVDLDVADNYINDKNEECIGVNLSVVNYSPEVFERGLERKILEENTTEGRYLSVQNAYRFHKSRFSTAYTQSDFFRITAFQKGISGRPNVTRAGGMGLVKLIGAVEQLADYHHCYILSGRRAMYFVPEYNQYDDGWIGFNKKNDYLTGTPDPTLFANADIYMPGTAFNLNFAFRKGATVL